MTQQNWSLTRNVTIVQITKDLVMTEKSTNLSKIINVSLLVSLFIGIWGLKLALRARMDVFLITYAANQY